MARPPSVPPAIIALLSEQYPRVHRLAVAMTGPAAPAVDRAVMTLALERGSAGDPDLSAAWFTHHTVLAARSAPPPAGPADDALARGAIADRAFIAALRALPGQQMQAFVLLVLERLDLRSAGVAMDCSRTATANHLAAAEFALQEIAATDYADRVTALQAAYNRLTPTEPLALPAPVRLRRRRWPWVVVAVAVVIAAVWAWWR